MIEQIIRVTQDLYGVTPVVHMVQGDTGRTLKCVVADYAFTGTETVSLMCLRPDKTVYRYDGTVDTSDNSANFELNVEGGALTQVGVVAAQVITVLNGAIVASFAINVIVHEVVGGEATEEDITFLMQLQEQLNEWIADAQTDVDSIIDEARDLIEEMVESMDEHFIPVAVTWAEYQALPDDKYTNGKIYFITDRGAEVDASTVPYDHTTSGLTATNVQDAIDEIDDAVDDAVPKTREINGYDLSEDRTLFLQDFGSKNLLPNTATTQTINGVTFTVNDDGSVTVNGTATGSNADFNIIATASGALDFLPSGDYILSGCPSGGSWSSYNLQVENAGAWVGDNGEGGTFTRSSSGEDRVRIHVATGTTVSNLTFYPMIRPAGTGDTYVPYAKTNVELTQDISKSTEISATFDVGNLNANSGIKARVLGNILLITGYINSTVAISTNTYIATIGAKPIQEVMESPNGSNGDVTRMVLRTNGRIQIESALQANEWFSFTFIAFIA